MFMPLRLPFRLFLSFPKGICFLHSRDTLRNRQIVPRGTICSTVNENSFPHWRCAIPAVVAAI